jgi:hypothetical protein
MKTFTLWHSETVGREPYKTCVASLREVYPGFVVLPVDAVPDGVHPGKTSDRERLRVLAEEFIGEDVLYVDADCMPREVFVGGEKPAFVNCPGGWLDVSVIYRPAGYEEFFRDLVHLGENAVYRINRKLLSECDRISGYPDNLCFKHLGASMKNGLKTGQYTKGL